MREKQVLVYLTESSRRSQEADAAPQAGSPIGIRVVGQNVVAAGDELLIHTEGRGGAARLGRCWREGRRSPTRPAAGQAPRSSCVAR